MAKTDKQIAQEVLDAVGGRENIASIAHCATRLRIMVNDKEKVNQEQVEDIEKVKGAFYNSGQYQIIFGTGTVNKIYDAITSLGIVGKSTDEVKIEGKNKAMHSSVPFAFSVTYSSLLFRYLLLPAYLWGYVVY